MSTALFLGSGRTDDPMFAWDALTNALDELDVVRAQLREARGQVRTARFYNLIRSKLVLSQGGGHVANVIELSGGWCVVHWLHDQHAVALYSSILSVRRALCADGVYLLSLVDSSDQMVNTNPRAEITRLALSDVEKDLMRRIGRGQNNREISAETGWALSTIKNRLSKLYRYLGLEKSIGRSDTQRAKAALLARDLDLSSDARTAE